MYIYIYVYIFNHEKNVPSRLPGYHHNGFMAPHALGQMMHNHIMTTYIYIYKF